MREAVKDGKNVRDSSRNDIFAFEVNRRPS